MSKPQKAFRRGYRFKLFQGEPAPTCSSLSSTELVVPLHTGPGEPAEPTVKTGDTVVRGQIIAATDGRVGNPIHAPASGTVESVRKDGITITDADASAQAETLDGASAEWENFKPDAIRELLYQSGSAGIDTDGIPTERQSSLIGPDDVERIIVKIIPDDIVNPDPESILEGDRFEAFVLGLKILGSAFPGVTVDVAISKSLASLTKRLEAAASGAYAVTTVNNKYPQSADEIVVQTVTGTAYAYGFRPINHGIVCLDYQTPIHAADAVIHGIPVISRRIAIAGSAVGSPAHADVPVGTPIASIIEGKAPAEGVRIVIDSLMTGETAGEKSVICKDTSGVYCIHEATQVEMFSFATPGFKKDSISNTFVANILPTRKETDTNLHGERRACLNCSFCADVCPVGIMPNILHRYVERDLVSETLPQLGILKCIDCNLCTYVCPSKIPLSSLMKQGKERLFDEGFVSEEDLKQGFALKGLD